MKDSLKLLRRRPLSYDPTIKAFFPLGSCTKISHASVKDSIIRKGKDENKDSCHCSSSGQSSASNLEEEETLMMQHPPEPQEIDHPIRCPPPEPNIIQDGRKCGQKLSNLNMQRGQLRFLTESEVGDLQNDQHTIHLGNEHHILASVSAREASIVNLLE